MESALHTFRQMTNLALTLFNPAFRKAQSRVRNGDMTASLFSPEKLPGQYRNNPDGFYSVRFAPDIGDKNYLLCRPFLQNLIENANCQTLANYAANRSIHLHHLPAWGQSLIKEIVLQRFDSFDPLQPKLNPHISKILKNSSTEERTQLERHIQRLRDTSSAHAGNAYAQELGLMSFATLSQFQAFIQSADKLLFSDLLIRSRFEQQITYFSVGNDGPLGLLALKTLKELVPLMFSIQIINDCMLISGTSPATQDLISWAKDFSRKAGDFPQSCGFKNILKLKNFISANNLTVEDAELKILTAEAFSSKNFDSFLNRKFPEYRQIEQVVLSTTDSDYQLRKSLAEAINIYCRIKDKAEIKSWASKLSKAIKKTEINYSQVVADLQQGYSPEQIYNQAFFDIINRNKIRSVNKGDSEQKNQAASGTSAKTKALISSYKIKIHFDIDPLNSKFGHNATKTIQKAIYRMQKGHFGNISYLGDAVFENRLHLLAGYRIYFTIRSNCLHIFKAGRKSTQEADLRACKKMARELTA